MISHGRAVASGSEGHNAAQLLCRRYIDLVVANASFGNDAKLWKARKHFTRDWSRRHDPAIDVAKQFKYSLRGQRGVGSARRKPRENNVAVVSFQKSDCRFIKKRGCG